MAPTIFLEPWPLRGTRPDEPTPTLTRAINDAADRLVAERVVRGIVREGQMSRLAEKMAKAAGVAQRATTRIEARADAMIAREDDIKKREDAAFSPHESILDDAEKGLQEVENALRLLSNAPLESSESASPDGSVTQLRRQP